MQRGRGTGWNEVGHSLALTCLRNEVRIVVEGQRKPVHADLQRLVLVVLGKQVDGGERSLRSHGGEGEMR